MDSLWSRVRMGVLIAGAGLLYVAFLAGALWGFIPLLISQPLVGTLCLLVGVLIAPGLQFSISKATGVSIKGILRRNDRTNIVAIILMLVLQVAFLANIAASYWVLYSLGTPWWFVPPVMLIVVVVLFTWLMRSIPRRSKHRYPVDTE